MINFLLLGAGRIGKMHAKIISDHPEANLQYVYDVNNEFALQVAHDNNAEVANSPKEAINHKDIDAILIASATPTHTEFLIMANEANKPVLCEKPIDLDINKVNECRDKIAGSSNLIQIGFNRRFDNSHAKVQQAYVNGEIGTLEKIIITSRDPAPPGLDYLNAAGGFFRDTTIHDFDLSRFILGEDPIIEISAFGDNLFDETVKKANDFDTAMFILKSKSGVLIHINNSRRAVYGYDQRVEIFGSKGMMISNNQMPTSVEKFTEHSTLSKDPIYNFFIERYEQAYKDQLNQFILSVNSNSKSKVTFEDGRNALILANAAYESHENKKVVTIDFS
ncbi:inositol 2-dehydrogenase [Alphaproteobacteria bacterium]|nr:inositol 2-dehydrogenase [Alphaproteobacteria bacterium]